MLGGVWHQHWQVFVPNKVGPLLRNHLQANNVVHSFNEATREEDLEFTDEEEAEPEAGGLQTHFPR